MYAFSFGFFFFLFGVSGDKGGWEDWGGKNGDTKGGLQIITTYVPRLGVPFGSDNTWEPLYLEGHPFSFILNREYKSWVYIRPQNGQ